MHILHVYGIGILGKQSYALAPINVLWDTTVVL